MSNEKEKEEEPSFVIKDRRHSQISEEDSKQAEDQKGSTSSTDEALDDFQIDFSTFVLSLTSSAFYHLGDMPDPQTGKKHTDLSAVKQTIDILLMLKEKTASNLDENEKKLLEQLIYELQMKYMAANK